MMKILPTHLTACVVLAWAASYAFAQEGTQPTAADAHREQSTPSDSRTSGPNAWRYQWFQGRWWYWLPEKRWAYWERSRWVDYTPPGGAGYPVYRPYTTAYPPAMDGACPAPCSPSYRAGRVDYGPGWGWGHGWNGQGYRWRNP